MYPSRSITAIAIATTSAVNDTVTKRNAEEHRATHTIYERV